MFKNPFSLHMFGLKNKKNSLKQLDCVQMDYYYKVLPQAVIVLWGVSSSKLLYYHPSDVSSERNISDIQKA